MAKLNSNFEVFYYNASFYIAKKIKIEDRSLISTNTTQTSSEVETIYVHRSTSTLKH